MNISEANALNTVLQWVLNADTPILGPVTAEEALQQAAWLADRANAAIHAGLTSDAVRAMWPETSSTQTPTGA